MRTKDYRQNKMANRDPNVEKTEKNSVEIPSNELFNFVVECDKYHVDTLYDFGKDKVNKLPVLRLPVVVGNAYAITRDAGEKEDLFHLLKRNSLEERPKLELESPATFKGDSEPPNSREFSNRDESHVSNTKLSACSDSSPDGEATSDPSGSATTNENLGIVKSILGPTFEDAVLRTLEFGKSLIQKNSEAEEKERWDRRKREGKRKSKNCGKSSEGEKIEKRKGKESKRRNSRRRIGEKEAIPVRKVAEMPFGRPSNVAKIRSLDSELKQISHSPEKIKRQLEALIQINKDEPLERVSNWGYFFPKEYRPLKPHLEYTVMPTTVLRQTCCPLSKDEGCCCGPKCSGAGSCCEGSKAGRSKAEGSQDGNSLRKKNFSIDERSTRSMPNPVARQAPEYISNALGPTLDVSIMDNLKLMRNLFRCQKSDRDGRGEPQLGTGMNLEDSAGGGKSASEMVNDLQQRVEELNEKRLQLEKEIEEEEREREERRKAFQEEFQNMRGSSMDQGEDERMRDSQRFRSESQTRDCEQKFEALKCRIRSEEDRLSSLKEMSDSYETVINEAKRRKDNLKRNQSLLDAWDVFASRVCHTRLPSFSKAICLERKSLRPNKDVQHCCFPQAGDDSENRDDMDAESGTERQIGRSKSLDGKSGRSCKPDPDEIPYPLQRDVVCGMHRIIKTCLCNEPLSKDNASWSSDEDIRKPGRDQEMPTRSKSDTGQREESTKLCRVLWAMTRINIFRDNSRTYEVMDATTIPPKCLPVRTEGVFVVKNPKKCCPEPLKRIS